MRASFQCGVTAKSDDSLKEGSELSGHRAREGRGGGRRRREEVVCPRGERVWRMERVQGERAREEAAALCSVASVPGGFAGSLGPGSQIVVPREPHQGSLDPRRG